jgi:uncharacterized protein (DUF4213/DUF364 family)
MFRGSLVTLIYEKTLRINSSAIANAEAITLMSADIDRIGQSMPLLHEMYASVLEIALALWLLYRLLGVAMIGAILWIVGKLDTTVFKNSSAEYEMLIHRSSLPRCRPSTCKISG